MLEVHLYGNIKKKFKPTASLAEDTIVYIPEKKNETFEEFLFRINIKLKDCGDCFVNGNLALKKTIIPEKARIGLFPLGMHLIDGGLEIKIMNT